MTVCHACRRPVAVGKPLSRTAVCPNCRVDLHCCRNCRFHDRTVHNQCRETQAEWVADKAKANFCDYFVFAEATGRPAAGGGAETVRKKLDDLFKKTG